jgi:hypothetical protein
MRWRAFLDSLAGPGGWGGLRAEYRAAAVQARADAAEGWWDLVAELRQYRQWRRRAHQLISGKVNPTRRDVRQAEREWKAQR